MYVSTMNSVAESDLPDEIKGEHRGRIFVREINVLGAQTQYLCMSPDGVNCFASAFSLPGLALAIERREAYERKTVADYLPALGGLGLAFTKSIAGSIVMHEVRDQEGRLLGVADMRSQACEMAHAAILSGRQVAQMDPLDFRKITFVAHVTRLTNGSVVYKGHVGEHPEILAAAKLIWFLEDHLREQHKSMASFVKWFEVQILRADPVQKGRGVDMVHAAFSLSRGGALHFIFVFNPAVSAEAACRSVHIGLILDAGSKP